MTTWATLRDHIRNTVITDPNATKWSNAVLLDIYNMATRRFCLHTAKEKVITFVDGLPSPIDPLVTFSISDRVPVPPDAFLPIDGYGYFSVIDPSGAVKYLYPKKYTDADWEEIEGFVVENGYVVLDEAPDADSSIKIMYYSYWDTVALDTDTLPTPQWSDLALGYLVGAIATTKLAARFSLLGNLREDPERGNPEDNASRAQQDFLFKLYDKEIANFPKQRRIFYP